MNVSALLLRLKDKDIGIHLSGDDIEVAYEGAELPPECYREIVENKPAIVHYLKQLEERTGRQAAGSSGIDSRHMVLLKPGKLAPAIFIMPGVEGYMYLFREIAKSVDARPAVYGIQMMGLNEGEEPLRCIDDIARQHIDWIKQVQPVGPYRLVGFSFGGLVVYEMIRQLEAAGERIDRAFILDISADAAAVGGGHTGTLLGIGSRLLKNLGISESMYAGWLLQLEKELPGMGRTEAAAYMIGYLREKIDYSSEDIDFWVRVMQVLINNVFAIRPVTGRVSASLTVVKAREGGWGAEDLTLGWSAHAARVDVFSVPGTHSRVLHNSLDEILERC